MRARVVSTSGNSENAVPRRLRGNGMDYFSTGAAGLGVTMLKVAVTIARTCDSSPLRGEAAMGHAQLFAAKDDFGAGLKLVVQADRKK